MKKTFSAFLAFALLTCSYDHIVQQQVVQTRHYSHGINYKAVVGKQFTDTIQSASNDTFQVEIVSASKGVTLEGHIISWVPALSDTGIKFFIVGAKIEKYDNYLDTIVDYFDTLRFTITVFDSADYYDCPGAAFNFRPQYIHGYKAVVGKPSIDTIREINNFCFQTRILSAPEGAIQNGPIISWTPSIADTGIKSFRFIMRSGEFVDTLKYTLIVFYSASYFDFAPIQKGFYWIYQGEEGLSSSFADHKSRDYISGSTLSYLSKITIDSIWNNNDSLFFKVIQKKYNRFNHMITYYNNTTETNSLPDIDSSFIAIYSHNVFYQIDDLFLSKLFAFRYIEKTFIPNDSQYYKYSICSYFTDNLRFESNQTVMEVTEGGCLHCFPNQCPNLVILKCKYASDVGLLEYNLSFDQKMLPTSNDKTWKFNLIEYNVGTPVKLN